MIKVYSAQDPFVKEFPKEILTSPMTPELFSSQSMHGISREAPLPAFYVLHLAQGLRAATEIVSFHAELVEHGEIKVGERQLGVVHLSAPTGVRADTGGRLMLFVALTVLEVSAVLESHVSSAHQDKRVVA